MTASDVERILRDVLGTLGVPASMLRAERTPGGWRVTMTDAAGRVMSTDVREGTPTVLRAALRHWAEGHD
jgi:hypothetical protein